MEELQQQAEFNAKIDHAITTLKELAEYNIYEEYDGASKMYIPTPL